ncbi:MAG: RNA pseudouridine synthase, partial [Oscillospiraceae bacterium]
AGLLSIATEKEKVFTAYHMMTEYVKLNNPQGRIYVVHRLDRDTSGVLMAAKNEKMKHALQDNWEELVTQRRYHALVEGRLDKKSGTITSWLKETKTMLVYSSMNDGDGLKAVTEFEVIKENNDYSLLDIQLHTGRKNQIRVHMKEQGHSVAGDKKYGARTNPIKRLGLHSYRLELKHPFNGEILCFEAKTPKCFSRVFKTAEKQ